MLSSQIVGTSDKSRPSFEAFHLQGFSLVLNVRAKHFIGLLHCSLYYYVINCRVVQTAARAYGLKVFLL